MCFDPNSWMDPAYDLIANFHFNAKRDSYGPYHDIVVYKKRDDRQDRMWDDLVNLATMRWG